MTTLVGFGVVKFQRFCPTQTSLLKRLFSLSLLSGHYRCACFLLNGSDRKAVHLRVGLVIVSDFLATVTACLEAGRESHNEAQH